MELLLVGEDSTFLSLLALDLSLRGFAVRLASDLPVLAAHLNETTPDLIVFDHVEPMDLFALNPRECGYEGPIILLVEKDAVPDAPLAHLTGSDVVTKPLLAEVLTTRILLLTGREG